MDTIIIGAGLTGLTAAHALKQRGVEVLVLEKENRIGGQIRTFGEDGFVFESGPNTGVIAHPEVAELFSSLKPFGCEIEIACNEAKQRWIWKRGQFHALPVGLTKSIRTTLFSWRDKLRILGEPFRAKGTDPDESVAQLVKRRLGTSYVDYAVDPFISGVYAGDATRLVTRYALPKLYRLEQTYGSFIRGAIAKVREKKTERERLATRQVFSAVGGLESLINGLGKSVGSDRIVLNAGKICVAPKDDEWTVSWTREDGTRETMTCRRVITTTGAYTLPEMLPFVSAAQMQAITSLRYAPIVQVSVGVDDVRGVHHKAFGGLIPTRENRKILGVLFPSACFNGRAPKSGEVYSFFLGGIKHPDMLNASDDEITRIVIDEMHNMLALPADIAPRFVRIFRHQRAIPQYEKSSGERLETINRLQQQFPGLIIAGNLRDGIGMADRIKQGMNIAESLNANHQL